MYEFNYSEVPTGSIETFCKSLPRNSRITQIKGKSDIISLDKETFVICSFNHRYKGWGTQLVERQQLTIKRYLLSEWSKLTLPSGRTFYRDRIEKLFYNRSTRKTDD